MGQRDNIDNAERQRSRTMSVGGRTIKTGKRTAARFCKISGKPRKQTLEPGQRLLTAMMGTETPSKNEGGDALKDVKN